MKVAISCDHAAFHLKEAIRAHLEELDGKKSSEP